MGWIFAVPGGFTGQGGRRYIEQRSDGITNLTPHFTCTCTPLPMNSICCWCPVFSESPLSNRDKFSARKNDGVEDINAVTDVRIQGLSSKIWWVSSEVFNHLVGIYLACYFLIEPKSTGVGGFRYNKQIARKTQCPSQSQLVLLGFTCRIPRLSGGCY